MENQGSVKDHTRSSVKTGIRLQRKGLTDGQDDDDRGDTRGRPRYGRSQDDGEVSIEGSDVRREPANIREGKESVASVKR